MIFDFEKEWKKGKNLEHEVIKENTTLLGITASKRNVYIPDNAKHVFVCGTTGSGKTIALSNFIKNGLDNEMPMLIVDGKGDVGENSILDIVTKLNKTRKVYIINMNDVKTSNKYNPFKNTSPTVIKDMLVNMSDWSEEHYKLNVERYLQRLIDLLNSLEYRLSLKVIIDHIPVTKFTALSMELLKNEYITKEEHQNNIDIAKSSGSITENATARFSSLVESEIGSIFDVSGIDIYTALKERAVIVFILNPLLYPILAPQIGRLIIIDSKKAVSKLFNTKNKRTFFILDEINVYASSSMLDLVNKSRSANVTCILATQSLSDLDASNGEFFKEQVIENCNNYVILRQNSPRNAENFSNIIGTRPSTEVTHQIKQGAYSTSETGMGSARRTREFSYHPDKIKNLKTGEAIFVSKENGYNREIFINKPF